MLHTLGDHAAVGRLTLDELEDRSSRALAAKTRGELATLTSDLPADAEAASTRVPAASRRKPVRWVVAILSGSRRRGRFRAVGRSTPSRSWAATRSTCAKRRSRAAS